LTVISVQVIKVSDNEEAPKVIWPQQQILDSAGLFNTTGPSASVTIPSSHMRRVGIAAGNKVLINFCERLAAVNT